MILYLIELSWWNLSMSDAVWRIEDARKNACCGTNTLQCHVNVLRVLVFEAGVIEGQ